MITICARYGSVVKQDSPYKSLQETADFIQHLQDDGQCYALGIYDPSTKTMHIPENMDVAGKGRDVVLEQKKAEFIKEGFEIDKIEFMIKANELRIGNLINNGFKTVVVRGIDAEGILLSMRLVCRSFDWNGRPETEYERLYLGYDLAEPIPLTPEILEKCGFVDPSENGWGCRLSINSADELCWYRQDGPEWGGHGNTVRYQSKGSGFTRDFNVKYLHQLQNLYFALAGEELTVNLS